MPLFFESAASGAQLNKLRGIGVSAPRRWMGDQYVSLRPNTTIFKARVNGAITGAPYAQIAYDGVTVGAIADVRPHFRVIVSPTDNRRDRNAITLRVRDETHTSSILYVSEDSRDIPDNWYIFVIEDIQLTDKLARPLSLTVQAKDYDDTFQRLAPVVDGLEAVYIGEVDSITGVMTISIDVSDSYAVDDNTWNDPLEFLFEFKSGTYTVTAGDLDEDALTVEIEEGHQIAQLTITDSDGVEWVRYFDIFAHGDTFTPIMGFDGAQWSGEYQNGFNANVTAFTGVDDVLDETFAVIWRPREFYNGVSGELLTGRNIDFVGWINREDNNGESDETYSFLSEVSFEFVGVGARLALLEAQILALRNAASPDEWDEIEEFYASWRGKIHFWQRHTTLLHLFPLAFSLSMKNSNYLITLTSNQGGNAHAAAFGLAQAVNGSIEFAPDGRIQVVRDLRYMTALDHTDAIKVATLDQRDLFSVKETRNHFDQYGQVIADGAFYNASTGTMTAVRAIAPGHARGRGAQDGTLSGQILTETAYRAVAEAELAQRASNYLLILNDEGNELTAEHPDGYFAILIPSLGHTYAWELDGSENVRGIEYDEDTLWLLKSASFSHDNNTGARTCTAVYIKLIGPASAGDTIEEIAPGEIELAIPDIPPFGAFDFELPETMFPLGGLDLSQINPLALQPPAGQIAKKDGSTLLIKSDDQAFLVQNAIIATTPPSYEITPPDLGDFEIQQGIFDPLNTGSSKSTANKYGYLLSSDGDDSHVHRTANIYAQPPAWLTGDDIDGLYTVLRGTNVDGGLLAYTVGEDGLPWEHDINFLVTDGGFTAAADQGDWTVGIGWKTEYFDSGNEQTLNIIWNFPDDANVTYTNFSYTNSGLATPGVIGIATGGDTCNDSPASGSDEFECDVTGTSSYINMAIGGGSGTGDVGSAVITSLHVEGLGYNPFTDSGGGDGAKVRYSPDRGDSWGSEIAIGDTPGTVGGVDVSRASGTSYSACLGKVRKATTLGGAYSDHTSYSGSSPVAVCILYFRLGSTTTKQTTASDPDYIVALNTPDTGSQTLYKVAGATATKTDITPVSGITFDSANCITTQYGTHIAVIGVVGGDRRCYVSTNTGGSWTLAVSGLSSNAKFLRARRGDTRAKNGGNHGQLTIVNGAQWKYSNDWGVTFGNHNLPIAANGEDILG